MICEGLEMAIVHALSFDCDLAVNFIHFDCCLYWNFFWLSRVLYAFEYCLCLSVTTF